jgi:hypothetical protein
MQYTGTSFSSQFAGFFEAILLHLRRGTGPVGAFPQKASRIDTHCVDVVEQRMLEVLGEGDEWVARTAARIPEEARFSFGLGLVVLVIIVGLTVSAAGGVP